MTSNSDIDQSLKFLYISQKACPNLTYLINHQQYRRQSANQQHVVNMLQWACVARHFDSESEKCLPSAYDIDHALIPKIPKNENDRVAPIEEQQAQLRQTLGQVDKCLSSRMKELQPLFARSHALVHTNAGSIYSGKDDRGYNVIQKPNPSLQATEKETGQSIDEKVHKACDKECSAFIDKDTSSPMSEFVSTKKLEYCILAQVCRKQLEECLSGANIGNFESCVTQGQVADCLKFE